MQHDALDDDWTHAPEPPSSAELTANRLATDPRVFRVDAEGEPSMPFATLIAALSEPPAGQESRIVDAAGTALAVAAYRRAAWLTTGPGAERVDAEAHGRAVAA
jgi:hypothetical protein